MLCLETKTAKKKEKIKPFEENASGSKNQMSQTF